MRPRDSPATKRLKGSELIILGVSIITTVIIVIIIIIIL